MAVDYGGVRTGFAVSDITQTLAGETWVYESRNFKETAQRIVDEAECRNVSHIVIGYPKNMDGTAGGRAQKCEHLAEHVRAGLDARALQTGVSLWDERLTTVSANIILSEAGVRGRKKKKKIDAVAAALILESYMSSIGNKNKISEES